MEVEKQLQTGLDPLAKTKHGYNALHLAIINNHPHVVNYLLQVTQEQNALIRAKTTHGDTLLHLIAKLPEEDAKKMTTVISSNKISINEILSNEVNDEQKLSQEYIIQAQETSEIGVSWEGRLAKTQAYFEKIKEQRAMIQKKLSHVQAEITASRGNIELNNLRDQEKFLQDEDKNCIAAMGKLRTELQDSKKMVDLAFEHQINSINNALNHSSKPALQTTATTQASSSRATQKPRLFLSTFALEPVQKLKAFIDSVANRGEWEITHSGNTITVQFREESKHENKDKAKGKALLPQLQDCLKQLPEWGQSVISNKSEGNILHIGCRHEDQAQAYAKALREFFGIETANTHTPSHQQSPCTMQ